MPPLTSPASTARLPEKSGGVIMARNAKVYEDRRRGVFYIQLYWKGVRYWRGHYDDQFNKMQHRDMADRIAHAINADIEKKKAAFDPRQWFKTPGYEFQFDLYTDKWLAENQLRYAPAGRTQVGLYCRTFTAYLQKTDLREIRKHDLKELLKTFPPTWGPKTSKNALGLLHKILTDAKDDELLEKLPGFPDIQVPEPEVKWITREWQDKIIGAIPERDRPIFIFIATWGVRPGEARALMWDCVDFEKEVITIRRTFSGTGCNHLQEYTKTKRVRLLPFTEDLATIFKRLRGIGGFVFRNSYGRPYTASLSRMWGEATNRIGAPKISLYNGTRHSFATQHLDKLDIVRQVLGHTRSDMTRRYQGINLEKIRKLVT